MECSTFLDQYLEDLKPRIKMSTMETKISQIDKHIRPFFGKRCLSEINSTDILQWQNALLSQRDKNGKGYSPTYLRSVQNQLTAAFNHAVKYYDLPKNPCSTHGKMGKEKNGEMLYWTKEEYLKFREVMKEKPMSYYAFQILYWTGIRCGELLALTPADFDFEKKTMRISKTFQVIRGKELITSPKTEKSNRVIDLPDFLCEEIEDYIAQLYKVSDDMRIFPVTKYYLHHEMDRGSKLAGIKRIRIHDLRHSSCALLISMGYSPLQIAERLGHENATVTTRYAHLYPSIQKKMAQGLNAAFYEGIEEKPAELEAEGE
jgi:integrase